MKMLATTTYHVTHTDLESFLNETYGIEFNFLQAAGRAYPDCVEYIVTGKLSDTKSIRKRAAKVRRGRLDRDACFLLNLLCADGHIPVGKYVIKAERVEEYKDWYLKLLEKYGVDSPECSQFKETHIKRSSLSYWCDSVDRNIRKYGIVFSDN